MRFKSVILVFSAFSLAASPVMASAETHAPIRAKSRHGKSQIAPVLLGVIILAAAAGIAGTIVAVTDSGNSK